ncbi:FAD-dependent monooxygenase [Niallia sp. 03133]|uniref:FAD-dependent monooxygenase n=1 Tax=Niallia sp. 03133 TaxID=3458060 RepID=UPI004043A8C5
MTVLHAEVCIVGAGPGGALLAYLLGKANISTILLERHENTNKEFRGEHLNEEGEKVLRHAGIYEMLQKKGVLLMDRVDYVHKGKVVKTIHPAQNIGHTGIHVPQSHLLNLLIKEASQFPSFRVRMNSKVLDISKGEKDHYRGVTALIDGKRVNIESQIIVAADGRFSTIRKKAEFPVKKIRHGYDLLWAKIPAPPHWEATIKMALVNDSQIALFTQYGGYIQIGWNIKEDSYPHLRKNSFQFFINGLAKAFPELKEEVAKHIRTWKDFVLLKVESSSSPFWVKNNVVLLGDAAHTMSPTGAFGLNSSLKDAEVLAEVIQTMITKNQQFSYLKNYERRRKEAVDAIQLEQFKREKSFKENFYSKTKIMEKLAANSLDE